MMGDVGILNVGAGDIKVSFDKANPSERIRAARIVKDMLRRGYALLVEVEQPDGTKAFQRALEFREDTCEYVIADLDPMNMILPTQEEVREEAIHEPDGASAITAAAFRAPKPRGRPRRTIKAEITRSVAVARSAGG